MGQFIGRLYNSSVPIHETTIAFYIIALIALAAFHAVLTTLRRPRVRFAAVAEGPRCQGCGYILFGESASVCPECGRDGLGDLLTEKSPHPPTPPIAAMLAAALLLFPITIGAAYPIAALSSLPWRGEAQYVIATPSGEVMFWAAVGGRGSNRKVEGNEVVFPGTPVQRRFHLNLNDMTLRPHRGAAVPATRAGVLGLLGVGAESADAATLAAADSIVGELQSLHDNRWPEDRFRYEMTGYYVITPDDDGGPFFWLPSYAPACVPVWMFLSFVVGRWVFRRYRGLVASFETKCCELRSLDSRGGN
jgi:hypothetical protein